MATDYPIHDAANIFPLEEETVSELAKDIKANGLREPIHRLGVAIIDGRRRILACREAGVSPTFRDVTASEVGDPVDYVFSLNFKRRHLTQSQLAMVGARARKWYDDEAKRRQKCGTGGKLLPVDLPEAAKGDARDQAGKAVGVSGKSVDNASRVLADGIPDLIAAVESKKVTVSKAAKIAELPADEQKAILSKPKCRKPKSNIADDLADELADEPEPHAFESLGVGVRCGNEAVNCLMRIPSNDPLRRRGFQIVADYIRESL